jgi:putative transposase
MKYKENTQQNYKYLSCPNCNSKNIIRRGIRKTKNRGEIQRFGCSDCDKRFVHDEGFFKMKNHEDKITACMNMYFSGMSLRKIQQHLKMFAPHNSHYSTIYRWIVKYADMISVLTDNVQIENGKELMSDEMEYKRLGEQSWFVDVLDTDTRFIVASEFLQSRTLDNLTKVLKHGRKTIKNKVSVITTDCLNAYPQALRYSFGVNDKFKNGERPIHNKVKADERGFNHKIERLHNTIRDRTKIMRGFHGSLYSAKMIMKGMEIYYNFVRKHQGIENKTPQEEAIPQLELGENKWLSLIKLSNS